MEPRWWAMRPAQNQKAASYVCPLCGRDLTEPEDETLRGEYLECRLLSQPILFRKEHMWTSHGICPGCSEEMLRTAQQVREEETHLTKAAPPSQKENGE